MIFVSSKSDPVLQVYTYPGLVLSRHSARVSCGRRVSHWRCHGEEAQDERKVSMKDTIYRYKRDRESLGPLC